MPEAHSSSFRDTAGFVFVWKNTVYRQVNETGRADFELMKSSGLYKALADKRLLIPHTEVKLSGLPADPKRFAILRPEQIPFISYPYEWSFAQLKDAALLTLRVQQLALRHGMVLKDASAYNVQFIGKKPILIDTLSFTKYDEGHGWEGYKQFCEHFLGPLALTHYSSANVIKLLSTYLEGIPLELTTSLLPARARLKKGLLAHLYVHKSSQQRHQGSGTKAASKPHERKVSRFALDGLLSSLERSVRALKLPAKKTEWDEYYSFSNYTDKAFKNKRSALEKLLAEVSPKPKVVWDLGANNGEFSEVAVRQGAYTIAWDIDPKAVNANYRRRTEPAIDRLMLPLVQDIAVPSPAIGWGLAERQSLLERAPADVVFALALIHHLAIGRNIPLPKVAELLARLGKHVIIEFVPKSDSKVQHLLASRKDIFDDYTVENFEAAMSKHFPRVKKKQIGGSKRWLYLYSK